MADIRRTATDWLPPLAGVAFIVLFVSLASWQLDRAAEKEATAALFDPDAPHIELRPADEPALYEPVRVTGRYLPDRQFLIDNIVRNGRLGYYVITPFAARPDGRLLLVNRGWIGRDRGAGALPAIGVGAGDRTLRARVGRLPRVALRPDEAIAADQGWPKLAVYPRIDDLAAALDRDISEPVLLLAPEADDGFLRAWQPPDDGATMHYGYAFQWSAMAAAVLVILVWHLRRRFRHARQ
ncbi:MAG: SURF1 family protein [Woeseiaceae bacterium]|nr:SURF1 family protein [Woeseiaceae bacterium]